MNDIPSLEEFRTEVREWMSANLDVRTPDARAPRHNDDHYTAEYLATQRALQRKLFEGRLAGITWPVEYGGRGLSGAHQVVFSEVAATYVLPDFGKTYQTTYGVCGPTLLACASDEFKARHIPRILAGDELWAQFFSEPDAGSDLANISTRAVRSGEDWVLSGTKSWTSFVERCDFGLCLARTDSTGGKHDGLTWFAIRIPSEGLAIRPVRQIDGGTGFSEELLAGVRVPDRERVGAVGDGWAVTRSMLSFERDSESRSQGVNLAPGPLSPDITRLAVAAGIESASVRQLAATAHVGDYVKEQVYARAAAVLGATAPPLGAAAYGKLASGILDPARARVGMELGGMAASVWSTLDVAGPDPGTAYLNGRMYSIAGGANEMQRNAIAERVLGLPREPREDLS
jgi:alkylation response protein AidB-like acyl-CoA dehydrogenase